MIKKINTLIFNLIFKIILLLLLSYSLLLGEESKSSNIYKLTLKDKQLLIKNNFWNESCPLPLDRLKIVTFNYYNFDGIKKTGEIIVLDILAPYVVNIFKELENLKFPINNANRFEAEFEQKNNTSSFVCRQIQNSKSISLHSYGAAIDVNPTQNPFVTLNKSKQISADNIPEVLVSIQPIDGQNYLNRNNLRAGMVESVINTFKNNGFTRWGGTWNTPIDFQHFEVPRKLIILLLEMPIEDAKYILHLYINSQNIQDNINHVSNKLSIAYKNNAKITINTIKNNEEDFLNNPITILNLTN